MKDTTIAKKSLKIDDSTEVTVPTSRSNAGPDNDRHVSMIGYGCECEIVIDGDDGAVNALNYCPLHAAAPAMAEALQALLAWAEEKYAVQPTALQTLTNHARSVLAQGLGEP